MPQLSNAVYQRGLDIGRIQAVSCVFQNIDPPLHPASVSSPRNKGGGTHSPGVRGGGGSIFLKTQDIGLASYSSNLSTLGMMETSLYMGIVIHPP